MGVIRRRAKAIRPAARTWRTAQEGPKLWGIPPERGPPCPGGCTSAATADYRPQSARRAGDKMWEECDPIGWPLPALLDLGRTGTTRRRGTARRPRLRRVSSGGLFLGPSYALNPSPADVSPHCGMYHDTKQNALYFSSKTGPPGAGRSWPPAQSTGMGSPGRGGACGKAARLFHGRTPARIPQCKMGKPLCTRNIAYCDTDGA